MCERKKSMDDEIVRKLLTSAETLILEPEIFIGPPENLAESLRSNAKLLYDHATIGNIADPGESSDDDSVHLTELYIQDFDSEQIWQQLEMGFERHAGESTISELCKLLTCSGISLEAPEDELQSNEDRQSSFSQEDDISGDDLRNEERDSELQDESDSQDEDSEDVHSHLNEDESEEEEDEGDTEKDDDAEPVNKPNKVDDKFFKMSDMEKFLDEQDALYEKNAESTGGVEFPDLFTDNISGAHNDNDDEDGETDFMYNDFFVGDQNAERKGSKNLTSAQNDEDLSDEEVELIKALGMKEAELRPDDMGDDYDYDEGEEPEEGRVLLQDTDDSDSDDGQRKKKKRKLKSEFEERNERLQERIGEMEADAMEAKPWQLMGEVTAKFRPENSLLAEDVEFDANVAPAPAVTVETTESLEAMIKQRIKDKAFDDVVRKERIMDDGEKFRKRIELNQEKSKLSLSQVYEQEYLKLRDADQENDEDKEEVDPKEEEIKSMMTSLFRKLDALSSFHYTPKQVAAESKITSRLPAMVLEEVQPETVTDASRLAPEEVKMPQVEVKDRAEFDETDKNRLRRKRKAEKAKVKRKKETLQKRVDKLNPGLGNKHAKRKTLEVLKEAKKSKKGGLTVIKDDHSAKVLSSSKLFFKALGNEVKMNKEDLRKKRIAKKAVLSSKTSFNNADKLKL